MIQTGKEIYNILSADSALTALVGTKIFPLIIPENTVLPCVIYERSFSNAYAKDGLTYSDSIINITIISTSYSNAIDISTAVYNALTMYKGGKLQIVRLNAGDEDYIEGAFIQTLQFDARSINN